MKLHTFKIGGVHPAENKIAAGKAIENLPLPAEVVLPVAQHIGAPAKPIVKKGDKVTRGQCVAEAGGFVSAPVHTPHLGHCRQGRHRPNTSGYARRGNLYQE